MGQNAQKAYNAVCKASPIVTDLLGIIGDKEDCISRKASVWIVCGPDGSIAQNTKTNFRNLVKSKLTGNFELQGSYKVSGDEKLSRHLIRPKNKIPGSESWSTSCSWNEHDSCGNACCCGEDEYYTGENCQSTGNTCDSLAMMYAANSPDEMVDIVSKFVNSTGNVDVDLVSSVDFSDLDADGWAAVSNMGEGCRIGEKMNWLTYSDPNAGTDVNLCFVSIAITESWGEYEDDEKPVVASGFLGCPSFPVLLVGLSLHLLQVASN